MNSANPASSVAVNTLSSRFEIPGTPLHRVLREAPYLARCSDDKTATRIRPREYSIKYPYMQVNHQDMVSWLIFDIDHDSPLIWEKTGLPAPNLVVTNRANGHAHLFYAIPPVCTSAAARSRPIQFMKAVYAAMAIKLRADPDFHSGPVAKTPGHPWWTTWEIHGHEYELGELADHVDLAPPGRKPQEVELKNSRHCILFDRVRHYAYSTVSNERQSGSFERFFQYLEAFAHNSNNFTGLGFAQNLPAPSLRHTVKSIARWTWDHYQGRGCCHRGVMRLNPDAPLPEKQTLAAQRTHAERRQKTESRIRAACRFLIEAGRTMTLTAVALAARLTTRTVAKYKHVIAAATKPTPIIPLHSSTFMPVRKYAVHQVSAFFSRVWVRRGQVIFQWCGVSPVSCLQSLWSWSRVKSFVQMTSIGFLESSPGILQSLPDYKKGVFAPDAQINAFLIQLNSTEVVSIEIETTGRGLMNERLSGLSFSLSSDEDECVYLPLAQSDQQSIPGLCDLRLAALRPWLEADQRKKVGSDLKHMQHVFANHGITLRGIADDVGLMSYVLASHERHDLKGVFARELGGVVPTDARARAALRLVQHLDQRLEEHSILGRLYREIELPIGKLLFQMERHGVMIDVAKLNHESGILEQQLCDLEEGMVLHRSLASLIATTHKLPQMINPQTGRVHTSFNQTVAVTGRLSSTDPNLQNIPVRTAEGRKIREAFIAPPGHHLVSADYSQIELRIMAHLSGDTALLKAFAEGQDIHRATAAEVFGVMPLEVSSEQRRYAKTINFGLIYGMSAFGLAQSLEIERSAAQNYIDRYFGRFPGVAAYMERTRAEAKRVGFVETVFGRRLWLPEIKAANPMRRAGAERAAINAPMQGTAADLIKLAMLAVQDWLVRDGLASKLVLQVHDELILEVPDAELELVREKLPRVMAGVASLKVPLVADVTTGRNWADLF